MEEREKDNLNHTTDLFKRLSLKMKTIKPDVPAVIHESDSEVIRMTRHRNYRRYHKSPPRFDNDESYERRLVPVVQDATAVNAIDSTMVILAILNMLCERIFDNNEDKKTAMFNALRQKLVGLHVINPLCTHEALTSLRDNYYRLMNALVLEHSFPSASGSEANSNLIVAKPRDVVVLKESFAILSKLMPAKWSPMLLLHPPRYRSDFEELKQLGKGGFGRVVEARNLLDNRRYAIKQIKLRCKDDQSFENVLREVGLLADLNHPNIVSYCTSWYENSTASDSSSDLSQNTMSSGDASSDSDNFLKSTYHSSSVRKKSFMKSRTLRRSLSDESSVGNGALRYQEIINDVTEDYSMPRWPEERVKRNQGLGITLYIQMELCGINLETFLQERNNRLADAKLNDLMDGVDICQCDSIFNQIVTGVEYIHSKNYMHRDIKPSNIFMGNNCKYVKIGDFGLARVEMASGLEIEPLTPISKYCKTGNFTAQIGTAVYAAPEQLNSENYDKKADMYSLGIVYFELLYPFGSGTERAKKLTRLKETSGNCEEVQEIEKRWSDKAEVIPKLLHNSPNERMSARDLLEKRNTTRTESEIIESLKLRLNLQDELLSKQAVILAKQDLQLSHLQGTIMDQNEQIISLTNKNKRLKDEKRKLFVVIRNLRSRIAITSKQEYKRS